MDKCIKCGGTLPAGAKLCPYCGNPVSFYEEKMQPTPPASSKTTGGRTILIVSVVVLGVLLISSLAFAIMLMNGSIGASPKLGVSPGSLDFGTLQVGSQSSKVLTLSNSGKQNLNWNADKGAANWLTLDPSQGSIPSAGSQTIYVRADTTMLTAGQYSASISFSSNGGGASVNAVLVVTSGPSSPGTPVVSGISPTSGPAVGGTTVTIRGSGFTGASQVLFGTATSTFTVNSDTQITVVSPAGSGTVHVTIITPKGTSATSSADQFTYQGAPPTPPIPTIASISPTSGPVTGGTIIMITGTGFTEVSKVLFGSTAVSYTVNTDKQITVKSPAVTTSGTVDVTVTTPGGTSNAARFNYYVPVPPVNVPVIKNISPTSGPLAGGTKVTITGTDLSGASKVVFGSVAASSFTRDSATQITAFSPAVTTSGTVDVTVTTPGGTSATSTVDRFTYVLAPTVTGISPATGPAAGGTSVKITGSNFTGASKVLFGSVAASSFTVNSATQITAVSPAGSGTVDMKVTTAGGTSATGTADRFTYKPAPKVTNISPTTGPAMGGTSVTITGTGFTGATKVLFGSIPAAKFTVDSDTQITAVSPASTAGSGTVNVNVITPGGTSNAVQFTYVYAHPQITGISPTEGPTTGGTKVTITGTDLTGASKVLFGTALASDLKVDSATQITAVSPVGSGTVDVTVTTPGGTSAITAADVFTYMPVQGAPTVTSIAPTSGPVSGGTKVIITGTGFTGASQVLFASIPAAKFTVNSATQITAFSPVSSVGTVDVKVTTPGGTSATSTADRFTYVPIPTVTSISPISGPLVGGTIVTIKGSGFTDASKVLFGSTASTYTVNRDSQITAYSPAGSAGTVHVTVTTPKGTSITSTADKFTYLPVPTITNISPTSGPIAGGTTVIIEGTGFTQVSKVLFGSTASIFTVNSSSQITVISPPSSAGTVDLKVTTPGGTSAISSVDQYTYRVAPTVASISPTSGTAAGGTFITITGTGFTGASQVLFGTVATNNFTVSSDTKITAFSPAGSGTVAVTVTTPGGTSATSNLDRFTYVPIPVVASISPNTGPVGTTVTITGTGFKDANQVMFGLVAATIITMSDTQITVTSPAASGTVHVTVTTPIGGTSATSNADLYQYT